MPRLLGSEPAASPRSIASRSGKAYVHARAGRVLEALVSILHSSSHLSKFASALPFTRICVLLLGEHPTSDVAVQILTLIGLTMKTPSSSFARKFELVSGWRFLHAALPGAWNVEVQNVAFDLLYGRVGAPVTALKSNTIACPQILPAILSALNLGLISIAQESFDEDSLCE